LRWDICGISPNNSVGMRAPLPTAHKSHVVSGLLDGLRPNPVGAPVSYRRAARQRY
jgi:hypothetical protein